MTNPSDTTVSHPPVEPPPSLTPGAAPKPRGSSLIAWIVIILTCIGVAVMQHSDKKPAADSEESSKPLIDVILMELQAKYMIGVQQLFPNNPSVFDMVEKSLNLGTVDQRLRFVIFAAEMEGQEEALDQLLELRELIREEIQTTQDSEKPFELTERERELMDVMDHLYIEDGDLTDDEHALLESEFGWFGKLALNPEETGVTNVREAVLSSARTVASLFIGGMILGGLGLLVGFVGLVVLLVFAFLGKANSSIATGRCYHGIYAETFAMWLPLFFALQVVVGIASKNAGDFALLFSLIAFIVSLLALVWPVMRGIPWKMVRHEIGWTLGTRPALEPVMGAFGYLMALPMLAIGIGLTFVSMLIQEALAPKGSPFAPQGGPAHPIILNLADSSMWIKIVILLIASVAAPIVEETMFRGVLYRHLREASARLGVAFSIILSGVISSFIFAAIHPQGWVAIPVLMALAFGFVLLREWRGSVIPAMIAHGISNGLVMTFLILAFGA